MARAPTQKELEDMKEVRIPLWIQILGGLAFLCAGVYVFCKRSGTDIWNYSVTVAVVILIVFALLFAFLWLMEPSGPSVTLEARSVALGASVVLFLIVIAAFNGFLFYAVGVSLKEIALRSHAWAK